MGKRQRYTTEQKTTIVLPNLRGEASVAELARLHGVAQSLIHKWKADFLEACFARLQGRAKDDSEKRLESENERLKRLLAEKVVELDVAKKADSLEPEVSSLNSERGLSVEPASG